MKASRQSNTNKAVLLKETGSLIAGGLIISDILIRPDSLPALIFISRYDEKRSAKNSIALSQITSFTAKTCEANNVENYWLEALKVQPTATILLGNDFEGSRPPEKIAIVYRELLRFGDSSERGESYTTNSSLLDERTFQPLLNIIIPVVVGSLAVEELNVVVRALMASSLAEEHIKNLATNFPHICSGLTKEIILLSGAGSAGSTTSTREEPSSSSPTSSCDPAYLWRSYRVFLAIASISRKHAIAVRKTIASKKLHPKLCLEITSRYVNDMDEFIYDQLVQAKKLCGFWLLESSSSSPSQSSDAGSGSSLHGAASTSSSSTQGSSSSASSTDAAGGAAAAAVASHLQHLQVTKICALVSRRLQEMSSKVLLSVPRAAGSDSTSSSLNEQDNKNNDEASLKDIVRCASVLTACSWTAPNIPEIEVAATNILDGIDKCLESISSRQLETVTDTGTKKEDIAAQEFRHPENILRVVIAMLICRITSIVSVSVANYIAPIIHGHSSSYYNATTGSGSSTSSSASQSVNRSGSSSANGAKTAAASTSTVLVVLQGWGIPSRILGPTDMLLKGEEFVAKVKSTAMLLERALALQDRLIALGSSSTSSTGSTNNNTDKSSSSSYLTPYTGSSALPWDSARTHRLFMSLITAYDTTDCRVSLSELCLSELKLGHLTDFLPYSPPATTPSSSSVVREVPEGNSSSHSREGGPMAGTVGSWILGATIKVIERCGLLGTNGSSSSSSGSSNSSLAALSKEFRQLRCPAVISAESERPGDWLCCLSLMFACNAMRSNMLLDQEDFEAEDNLVLGGGDVAASSIIADDVDDHDNVAEEETESNRMDISSSSSSEIKIIAAAATVVLKSESSPGSTHDLMRDVIASVRWPPHSWLQRGIDGWILRCAQSGRPGVYPSSTYGRNIAVNNEGAADLAALGGSSSVSVGLPLLPNEAANLSSSLQECDTETVVRNCTATGADHPICKECVVGGKGRRQRSSISTVFYRVPHFSVSHRYRRSKFPPPAAASSVVPPVGIAVPTLRGDDLYGEVIQEFLGSLGVSVKQAEGTTTTCCLSSSDNDDEGGVTCTRCGTSSSSSASSSSSEVNKAGPDSASSLVWSGVMACYSALQFAALSAEEGMIYNGPFVCDLRTLPIKRSLQYLLLRATTTATGGDVTAGTILATMIELVEMQCPELILPERLHCYGLAIEGKIKLKKSIETTAGTTTTRSSSSTSAASVGRKESHSSTAGGRLLESMESLFVSGGPLNLGTVLSVREKLHSLSFSETMRFLKEVLLPQAIELHRLSPASSTSSSSRSKSRDSVLFADNSDSNNAILSSKSSLLWEMWKHLHDFHPIPQQLELATINCLLSSIADSKSHALWYASRPRPLTTITFTRLMQEPLMLFRLPLELLRHPFTCRLVCFITRSALAASRSAVHEALRAKQRTAASFLSASLKDRSLTEACIDIDEELYFDLQELMAVRVILQLGQEVAKGAPGTNSIATPTDHAIDTADKEVAANDNAVENGKPELTAQDEEDSILSLSNASVSLRCDVHGTLTELLHMLLGENSHLCSLLLDSGIDVSAFELLLTTDEEITENLGHCLLAAIMSTTEIIAEETSNSRCITITPKALEDILRHSLCFLRFRPLHDLSRRIALALPAFMIRATSSVNPNLPPRDTRYAEEYLLLVAVALMDLYPDCALRLLEFAHSTAGTSPATSANVAVKQGPTAAIMASALAIATAAEEDDKPLVKSLRTAVKAAFGGYAAEGQFQGQFPPAEGIRATAPSEGAYLLSFITRQGANVGAPGIQPAQDSIPSLRRHVSGGKSPATITACYHDQEEPESGHDRRANGHGKQQQVDVDSISRGRGDLQVLVGLLASDDAAASATSANGGSGSGGGRLKEHEEVVENSLKRPRSLSTSSEEGDASSILPQKVSRS